MVAMGSSKRHQTKQRSTAERCEAAVRRGVVGNDGYGDGEFGRRSAMTGRKRAARGEGEKIS
jgi:hypothetical protein